MLMKYLCAERNAKHAKQYIDDENRIVTIGLFRDINRMIEHEFPEVQFFDLDGRVFKNVVFTLCSVEFDSHVNISIQRCGITIKLNAEKEVCGIECNGRWSFKRVLASVNECAALIETAFAIKDKCVFIRNSFSRYHCLLIYKYLLVVWKTGMTRDLRILLWSYLQ